MGLTDVIFFFKQSMNLNLSFNAQVVYLNSKYNYWTQSSKFWNYPKFCLYLNAGELRSKASK